MDTLIADVSNQLFEIELALDQQRGVLPLPFASMDKTGSAVCNFYLQGLCNRGTFCPFRHVRADSTIVCKHWLRGLCKKGDDCEFLHEYDASKMPECYFFSKFGECANKECPFKHVDPNAKVKDCPWYDRGFCRHGPNCRNKHVRRVLCQNYLTGFCPSGLRCKFAHPRWELPVDAADRQSKKVFCHFCGEPGHKIYTCLKATDEVKAQYVREKEERMQQLQQEQKAHMNRVHQENSAGNSNISSGARPLDEVVCFKCGEMGHYANKCPKGHLAFLHNPSSTQPHGQHDRGLFD